MKRYPLKLESVNHDILWGGTLLSEQYGKPAGKIAEAWELTVHPQGINRILNGEYRECSSRSISAVIPIFP
jgi:mannose-6-phosphate isomerase class I